MENHDGYICYGPKELRHTFHFFLATYYFLIGHMLELALHGYYASVAIFHKML